MGQVTEAFLQRDARVALVHYWYLRRRGGERVFDVLAEMFPQADLYIMVADRDAMPPATAAHRLFTSPMQKIPGAKKHYRKMMPLMPWALESFNLDAYDLVISHEAGPTHGVLTRSRTCHINYSHSPMRYVWEMYHDYRGQAPGGRLGRAFYGAASHYVRLWDHAAADRVDWFVASSSNCAARIRKFYRRECEIVYPPADLSRMRPAPQREDFYLAVSPLVQYKRVDLAVRACNHLQRRLVVVGEGEQMSELRKIAGPTIEFLGFQSDEAVRDLYGRCRAFLFPGEEDIGLTPIEAQGSGAPVIAYGRGGALETVRGWRAGEQPPAACTGVFFDEQTPECLVQAIVDFEAREQWFDPQTLVAHAAQFDVPQFKRQMMNVVGDLYERFHAAGTRAEAARAL